VFLQEIINPLFPYSPSDYPRESGIVLLDVPSEMEEDENETFLKLRLEM